MASLNEVRDRYIIETHLDNQIDAAGASAKRTLDALSASAAEAAKRTLEAGAATGTAGQKIAESQRSMSEFALSAHETSFIMRVFAVDAVAGFTALAAGAPLAAVAASQVSRLGAELILSRHGFTIFREEASAAIAAIGGWSVAGPIAAIAAIAAGLALAGAAAESSERKFNALSVQLMATRSDAFAMANEVKAAAQAASATGQIGTSEALQAGQKIAASPNFSGTSQDLQGLILTSQRLGEVMGDAAKGPETLRGALDNAGKVAQELADQHFPGFTQALAATVQQMWDTGNATGAAQKVIDELSQTTDKAKEAQTPLQKSLEDLAAAFSGAGDQGQSFAHILGAAVINAVSGTAEAVAGLINLMKSASGVAKSVAPMTSQQLYGGVPGGGGAATAQQLYGGVSPSAAASMTAQQLFGGVPEAITSAPKSLTQFGPPAPTAEQIQGIKAADEAQKNFNVTMETASKINISHEATITRLENQNQNFLETMKGIDQGTEEGQKQFNTLTLAYIRNNEEINKLSGSVQKHTAAHKEHLDVITKDTEKLLDQIKEQQRLAVAYGQGSDAVAAITVQFKAEAMALSEGLIPGKQKYIERVQQLIPLLKELSQAEESVGIKKAIESQQKQIDLIGEQTKELGQNTDVAAQNMSVFKALAEVKDKYNATSEKEKQTYVDNAVKITDMTRAYEQQRNSVDEVANFTVNAMDTIGNAITASFVQGSASAVNWGNVMKSIVAQVVQEFAKLAILNPILNSVFGGTRATMSGAFGGISGDATTDGGSGGMGGMVSNVGSIGSAYNLLSGKTFSSIGNLFSPGGMFGSSGSIAQMMATPLWSTSALSAGSATNMALAGMGSGVYGPATAGAVGSSGGAVLGTVAGPLAGFGAGAFLGNTIQSALGKTGPAPYAGAALGAGIGLIGGPIGALIGGIIGGAGGGLIGPKPPSPYSSTYIGVNQAGHLDLGRSISQLISTEADRAAAQAAIDQVNAVLTAAGVEISSIAGVGGAGRRLAVQPGDLASIQIGQNSPKGTADPSKFSDLGAAFSSFRFSSTDPHTQAFLTAQAAGNGGAWPDPQTLATTIATVKQFVAAVSGTDFASSIDKTLTTFGSLAGSDLANQLGSIATFVSQTVPALLAVGTTAGSLNDAITALNAQFAPAIAQAQQLAYKESELTAARDKAIAAATAEVVFTETQVNQGLVNRGLAAQAVLSGNPQDARAAQLAAFDTQAEQQRHDLSAQLVATFGDAVKSTANYASVMGLLESTLGKERLAVAKQYDDAIVASAKQAADTAAAAAAAAAAAQAKLVADTKTTWANNDAVYGRYLTARAANDNNATEAYTAQLYNFDVQAKQQRDQLSATLKAAFGDAFAQDKNYAYLVKSLDTTLAQERLQIAKQFNEQIASVSLPVITSIAQYAKGLQTGNLSPLSPQATYTLASQQFGVTAGAAGRGDLTSLQNLSGAADTMLTAARALYGSGQSYVDAFNSVLDALTKVSTMTPDTLTASVLISETRTQTQQLVDQLTALKAEVVALRDQVRQTGNMPARLAA